MDREEAEQLARRFAPSVYRLAYARTGHRADAEDVMQEVFLRLMPAAPDFRDDEHAKAWLLRVAANCAGDLFRSALRRRARPLEEALGLTQPGQEMSGVLEAVITLPSNYRIPLHLFYYEGYFVAEIARLLGKSEDVIRTRLHRGRGMLRRGLEGDEEHV